ncbi:hypothetical protein [Thioalkalivibrio sp. ALE30]|uniref:hypothetical protein n=1 Tax=Thioalkalivibrio sp. ALE30 TaxID=1158181 RepID=UPI0012DF9FC8|nr:hypothetical protein [Thioalkalivibrio sp. ALE30]
MKVAFHFNADHSDLGNYYGAPIRRAIFGAILRSRTIDLHTKVFEGDLLLYMQTMDREKTEQGEVRRFNRERFLSALENLLNPGRHIWMSFSNDTIQYLVSNNVFVVLLESISFRDAQDIDKNLAEYEWYLGGLQIDDTSPVHWGAYANALLPHYRIIGQDIHQFWDGITDDSKDYGFIEELKECGFERVEFEPLNGKFTVFDKYHDFRQARRVAELANALSDSLGMLADQVITRMSDAAPELGNKLWSAIRTYDRAEVDEDYAQVSASCRRVIEYVSDVLFPPTEEAPNGRKLGPNNYRNRLLAYADEERRSDTNIDLICASTEMLAQQLEKLGSLVNKGIHSDVLRHEARRCLLRTIMVLDDILSLRKGPLEIRGL